MADMMKNSSMHTAPKGRMPPKAMLKTGFVYHTYETIEVINHNLTIDFIKSL